MSNPKVDQVVDAMNDSHRGQSFQYETDLIANLQNTSPASFAADIGEINARVKMTELGFPEDFRIVSASADNRLTTISEDGSKYQIRNGATLDIQQESPIGVLPPAPGTATGRDFVARTDGSAEYSIKAGDTMWNITKEVLSRNSNGHVPTSAEIDQTYRKIAEANALKNPNQLAVGQKLIIPPRGAEGVYPIAQPAVPGYSTAGSLTSFSPNLKPSGEGVFNPMAAAGLPGGDEDYVYSRSKTYTENTGSSQRSVYTGWLRDSTLGLNGNNTKFDAFEVTDAAGRILSRHIDYSNPLPEHKDTGAQIKFDRGFGSPMTLGVRSVDTSLDITGNYQSTIRTDDGKTYYSITDSQGKVLKFYQA